MAERTAGRNEHVKFAYRKQDMCERMNEWMSDWVGQWVSEWLNLPGLWTCTHHFTWLPILGMSKLIANGITWRAKNYKFPDPKQSCKHLSLVEAFAGTVPNFQTRIMRKWICPSYNKTSSKSILYIDKPETGTKQSSCHDSWFLTLTIFLIEWRIFCIRDAKQPCHGRKPTIHTLAFRPSPWNSETRPALW